MICIPLMILMASSETAGLQDFYRKSSCRETIRRNFNDKTAYPLLISTKGNGRASLIDFPFVLQFNEMLVAAYFNERLKLLNVYDNQADFGFLSLDNLMDRGFLVKTSDSEIIPLNINHKSGIRQIVNIAIRGDSLLLAHQIRYIDYDAMQFEKKKEIQKTESWNKLFELDKNFSLSDFLEMQIPGSRKQLQVKFQLHQRVVNKLDYLLIQPLQVARISENPFKETGRNYPIDFSFTFSDNYTAVSGNLNIMSWTTFPKI